MNHRDLIFIGSEALGNMSVGASSAVGILGYINQNSTVISLVISFVGVLCAIIFYVLNYQLRKKEYELKLQEAKRAVQAVQTPP